MSSWKTFLKDQIKCSRQKGEQTHNNHNALVVHFSNASHNAPDQRPGATDPRLSTRALSPGSLHLVCWTILSLLLCHLLLLLKPRVGGPDRSDHKIADHWRRTLRLGPILPMTHRLAAVSVLETHRESAKLAAR